MTTIEEIYTWCKKAEELLRKKPEKEEDFFDSFFDSIGIKKTKIPPVYIDRTIVFTEPVTKVNDYIGSRAWSDTFIPQIKILLSSFFKVGSNLIKISNERQDTQEATDLMMGSKHVACRMRKHFYTGEYINDITIRSKLDTGTQTEYAKIISGYGDYLFYGLADETNTKILIYTIVDLNEFRNYRNRMLEITMNTEPFKEISNRDGTYFRYFQRNNPDLIKLILKTEEQK